MLEITETALLQDAAVAAERLGQLKALGVQLAIDDFGTGYSSLSYLKRFPVDVLKLDKSFVDAIELAGQSQILQALGCQYAQGFLFSKPLQTSEIDTLLAADAARGLVADGLR